MRKLCRVVLAVMLVSSSAQAQWYWSQGPEGLIEHPAAYDWLHDAHIDNGAWKARLPSGGTVALSPPLDAAVVVNQNALSHGGALSLSQSLPTPTWTGQLTLTPASSSVVGTSEWRIEVLRGAYQGTLRLDIKLDGATTSLSMPSSHTQLTHTFFVVEAGEHLLNLTLHDASAELETLRHRFTTTSVAPVQRDSDFDGIPDLVEVALGMHPLQHSDAQRDLDGDGWGDLDEFLRFSDPRNEDDQPQDSDGDGWSDSDEQWRGTESGALGSDARAWAHLDYPVVEGLYQVERLLENQCLFWDPALGCQAVSSAVQDLHWHALGGAGVALSELLDATQWGDFAGSEEELAEHLPLAKRLEQLRDRGQSTRDWRVSAHRNALVWAATDDAADRHYWLNAVADVDISRLELAHWSTAEQWREAVHAALSTALVQRHNLYISKDADRFAKALWAALALESGVHDATPQAVPAEFDEYAYTVLPSVELGVRALQKWKAMEKLMDVLAEPDPLPFINRRASVREDQCLFDEATSQAASSEQLAAACPNGSVLLWTDWLDMLQQRDAQYYALRLLRWAQRYRDADMSQEDSLAEADLDQDGISNRQELGVVGVPNSDLHQIDSDQDGTPDALDRCLATPNRACTDEAAPQLRWSSINAAEPSHVQTPSTAWLLLDRVRTTGSASLALTVEAQSTATRGIDFELDALQVQWAPGQRVQRVPIRVLQDAQPNEALEHIVFSASSPSSVLASEIMTVGITDTAPDLPRVSVQWPASIAIGGDYPLRIETQDDPSGQGLSYRWELLDAPSGWELIDGVLRAGATAGSGALTMRLYAEDVLGGVALDTSPEYLIEEAMFTINSDPETLQLTLGETTFVEQSWLEKWVVGAQQWQSSGTDDGVWQITVEVVDGGYAVTPRLSPQLQVDAMERIDLSESLIHGEQLVQSSNLSQTLVRYRAAVDADAAVELGPSDSLFLDSQYLGEQGAAKLFFTNFSERSVLHQGRWGEDFDAIALPAQIDYSSTPIVDMKRDLVLYCAPTVEFGSENAWVKLMAEEQEPWQWLSGDKPEQCLTSADPGQAAVADCNTYSVLDIYQGRYLIEQYAGKVFRLSDACDYPELILDTQQVIYPLSEELVLASGDQSLQLYQLGQDGLQAQSIIETSPDFRDSWYAVNDLQGVLRYILALRSSGASDTRVVELYDERGALQQRIVSDQISANETPSELYWDGETVVARFNHFSAKPRIVRIFNELATEESAVQQFLLGTVPMALVQQEGGLCSVHALLQEGLGAQWLDSIDCHAFSVDAENPRALYYYNAKGALYGAPFTAQETREWRIAVSAGAQQGVLKIPLSIGARE